MKRLIIAASFAVLAVPAFAFEAGLPYEQTVIDRALPNVQQGASFVRPASVASAPYEQNAVDRALPNIEPRRTRFAAASGATRTDAGIAAGTDNGSVWATDHNFIAPAQ